MMLIRGWRVMDKGDIICVGEILSKPLVDVATDKKSFVVVVCLNEVGVAMNCLEGVE